MSKYAMKGTRDANAESGGVNHGTCFEFDRGQLQTWCYGMALYDTIM